MNIIRIHIPTSESDSTQHNLHKNFFLNTFKNIYKLPAADGPAPEDPPAMAPRKIWKTSLISII